MMKEKKNNKMGMTILLICSILTVIILIVSIFFSEQIINLFTK